MMKSILTILGVVFLFNSLEAQVDEKAQNCFLAESSIEFSNSLFEDYKNVYQEFNQSSDEFHFLHLESYSGADRSKLIETKIVKDTLYMNIFINGRLSQDKRVVIDSFEKEKLNRWIKNLEAGTYSLACAYYRSSPYRKLSLIRKDDIQVFSIYLQSSEISFLNSTQKKKIENSINLITYLTNKAG